MNNKMPKVVRNRLTKYFRILKNFCDKGIVKVRSSQIANEIRFEEDIDSSTVRRDLAYLGNNGRQGYGYNVNDLMQLIAAEIGLGHQEEIMLIGVGNMGTALIKYNKFKNRIGQIMIAFDLNETPKEVDGVMVYHIDELEKRYKSDYRIAIIAAPSRVAQEIAEKIVNLGVRVIINYTDENIIIKSKKVKVENIDLNYFIQEAIYSIRLKGY